MKLLIKYISIVEEDVLIPDCNNVHVSVYTIAVHCIIVCTNVQTGAVDQLISC